MSLPSKLIINGKQLVAKLGYWPDFHDFEVMRVEMDRSGPTITIQIYCFHTLKETDNKGYFKKTNECAVTFRFNGISDIVLEDFNYQNCLACLTFEEVDGLLKTIFETTFGLHGYIVSKNLEIIRIEDYNGH